MNKEELAFFHLLDEYLNVPRTWESYKIIKNAIDKNKKSKKIIDKLSRKIQKLKNENRLLNNQFKIQILRGNRGYGKCYENKINFLIEREKKLQLIEQMFTSGHVDLFKLDQLVRFNKF